MQLTKPAFLLTFIFLMSGASLVFAQSDSIPPQIINLDTNPIPYCSDSVLVVPNISIQNIEIDEDSEGMKISIANYKRYEDILVWDEVHDFIYKWNDYYGHLEIKGAGTEKEYEEAIARIYYKNLANVPTLGERSFSISLLDADYLPQTEHFYRYVSKRGIKWTEARDSAANMEYYGLEGYLVTITSSAENDFVWTKIDGIGWIGANDSLVENKWQWETGPEKGTHFWQGNYQNGYKVNGQYSFWNTGEPNNVQKTWGDDEDYAHINANPNTIPKSWNDLSNEGDKHAPNGYYYPQGFIVEFGGMPNDPEVKLSASAKIEIFKIAFSDKREFTICADESKELNIDADDSYTYSWSPAINIDNVSASNPIVSPKTTTIFTAIGSLNGCSDTAQFVVNVNPVPVNELENIEYLCEGAVIDLEPGEHTSYLWQNGTTEPIFTVADDGKYWVTLTNEYDCDITDTVEVKWSVKPELDYAELDTLICGTKTKKLNLSFIDSEPDIVISALQSGVTIADSNTLFPTITVDEFGMYDFWLHITNEEKCEFEDTLLIEFHNQPEAKFDMDEDECKGYSLDLSYSGTTVEETLFSWLYNDTVYQSEIGLDEVTIPLGFGELNRTVGLAVNEQGCVDTSVVSVTVTPDIKIKADKTEGCNPLEVEFNAESTETVKSYLWDFGDGNSASIQNPTNTYINSETIDVSFDVGLKVVSEEGCENQGTLEDFITVHPIPGLELSFDEADCNPAEMEIYYAGSASDSATFTWELSSFLPKEILQHPRNSKGPLIINRTSSPTAEIWYSVVSKYGCETGSEKQNWKRKPLFEIQVDTTQGCPPLEINANAIVLDSIDELSYTYDFGDGTTGAGSDATHIYTVANTSSSITFIGTSDLTGCVDTVTYNDSIQVHPVPEATFTANPEIVVISDPEIQFENQTLGGFDYEWDFGDFSSPSEEENPLHRYQEMGLYPVLLSAYNEYGCLDTISKKVTVTFDKLYPPNAFSPNAVLEEDREFRIYAEGVEDEGYELLIFNRWGEEVFTSNTQNIGWDGKMKNGNFAPTGVYTWVLQYRDFRNEKHKQQGIVTLVF